MADRADVVVVGGGILGTSLTIHLLEAGVANVRLLERDGLFEGTTASGGGFVAPWSVLNPMHGVESKVVPVERYGLEFYRGLHEAGYDVEYRNNGVLWVTASEETHQLMRKMAWTEADPDSIEVDPSRVEEFTGGVVKGEGVSGARWLPCGAQVFTPKVGRALADRISKRGGTIETRRPVTEIRLQGDRVVGVDTPHGPVECDTVVVAAGAWSAELVKPLGVFLPAVPQVTSRIITGPLGVPDSMPVLMVQGIMADEPGGGTVLWIRAHRGGLLWGGMYLVEPRNLLVDAPVPDRFDELPINGVEENRRVGRAASFLPALSAATSIRVRHGAPCYTPDDLALVGAVPGIPGLYVLGGDNELGVTHGPGFGKALAAEIVTGSSELVDLRHWRIDRFGDRYSSQADVREAFARAFGQVLVGGTASVTGS